MQSADLISRRRVVDLLNRDRLKQFISIQPQGAAPERRLEDVVNMFAVAFFTGLDKQASPFERAQDAGRERGHFAPSGVVPIRILAIERREQRPLGGVVVRLDVDDVHPDIPFAEGALVESRKGHMVDFENEERDEFGEQSRG